MKMMKHIVDEDQPVLQCSLVSWGRTWEYLLWGRPEEYDDEDEHHMMILVRII